MNFRSNKIQQINKPMEGPSS